jgi:hypothetical protein
MHFERNLVLESTPKVTDLINYNSHLSNTKGVLHEY